MAREMRIVGWNPDRNIFVQFKVRGEWEQVIMTLKDFKEMMIAEYPIYWKEWEEFEKNVDEMLGITFDSFFYHYGEDNAKHETYIFR